MLQLKRPYKAISLDVCKLCMEHGESIDQFFLHCPLALKLWYKLFGLTKMDWTLPKSIYDMMTISLKDWEALREAQHYGNCLSCFDFGLCGKKKVLGFFRTRQGLQRFFEIPFISLLLFRPLTLQLLRAFPLMWFNLIGYRYIVPRVWVSKERLLFVFTIWFMLYHRCLGLFSTLEVPLFSFYLWEDSSPFYCNLKSYFNILHCYFS